MSARYTPPGSTCEGSGRRKYRDAPKSPEVVKRREESEYGVSDEIAGALTIKMGDPTERPCALTNVVSASRTRRRIGISSLVLWTTATALARQPGPFRSRALSRIPSG